MLGCSQTTLQYYNLYPPFRRSSGQKILMMQGRQVVVVVAVFSCLNGWATTTNRCYCSAQKEMKSFSGKFLVSRYYLNGYQFVNEKLNIVAKVKFNNIVITYLNYVLYLLYLFTYLLSYLFRKMKEIFIVSTHVSPIFDPYVYKVVKFFIRPNNNLTEIS